MNEYEISYISDPSLAEDARQDVDKAVDGAIESAAGSISSNTENTRRRLAYPVQNQSVGFLRTVQATIDPEKVVAVRQALQKQAGIIRLSILQTPARESVAASIFEAAAKEAQVEPAKAATTEPKKPAKEITDQELEEKIESALDEEVK